MGFLLAGGKSSRMGPGQNEANNKVFMDFGGQTLLDRALSVLRPVCDHIAIVGDPAKFMQYESVVADIFPGCGPLGGIHSALHHSSAEFNLMLAVDMPFVSQQLLEFLFTVAESEYNRNERNNAVLTVPRSGIGLQPLCAIYRREFAAIAEQSLRAGKYKITATFSDVSVRVIEEAELAAAGFPARMFFNVNTPQDRLDAERGPL
jgi:molybdopterin-guanine dinucleotide biosynthesis protein A